MIGKTLLHYEVTARIGAGGMGEVYRATDTKLGREVAIKCLPAEVAKDPERLARFQREAHLLASLNHPHIAAIYGLEETGDQSFLVLELVEGEDLQQRLKRGAIPLDEALEIARQVAEALEEAHNRGIVHRDLKPANVKVTPDGEVKVLDFGLAKAWAGDADDAHPSSVSMSQSPTLAHAGTAAGVILGTAAYMSPEQTRGRPVDKRGDVWAFGVLLWEMLTGRTLFAGDTVTDILAGIVKDAPDLGALPAETPRTVRWLIARCLRKDLRTRLPDIGAARLALQDVLAGTNEPLADESAEATGAGRKRGALERWALVAVSVLAIVLAAVLAFSPKAAAPATRPAVRFTVEAPEGWSFQNWPAPSPDGRHIAIWVTPRDPEDDVVAPTIWLHSLESGSSRLLRGTQSARRVGRHLFWSPDSRFIGFVGDGELLTLSLESDGVQRICVLPAPFGTNAYWHEDGTIIVGVLGFGSDTEHTGLYTVQATGGEPRRLLMPDSARGERLLVQPQVLPDGRHFLFAAAELSATTVVRLGVYAGSLDRPDERYLFSSETGHLEVAGRRALFNREGTLLAQSLDTEGVALAGEPVPIASSVAFRRSDRLGMFGVSSGGVLAYLSGEEEDRSQLAWLDRKGRQIETVGAPDAYHQIALSPDGRRIAATVVGSEGQRDLWVIDTARGVSRRLTSDPEIETNPVWSADGQELAFTRETDDGWGLFRMGLHRGGSAAPLLESPGNHFLEDWSRDGDTLLFAELESSPATESSLWELPLGGEGPRELIGRETGLWVSEARLSPDGRWLAYVSTHSGAPEVYVEPFGRDGETVLVSVDGGGQPKWRGDGRELFYRRLDGPLMAVEVREAAGGIDVGLPAELFDAGEFRDPFADVYAVSADGQRFLVMLRLEDEEELRMNVVVNWESLLE